MGQQSDDGGDGSVYLWESVFSQEEASESEQEKSSPGKVQVGWPLVHAGVPASKDAPQSTTKPTTSDVLSLVDQLKVPLYQTG